MISEKYNRHQIPPDWNLATMHMQATKPGRQHVISKEDQRFALCPCCCSFVDKNQFAYFEADKELFFLGQGFPLFYNTLKFTFIMMFLLLLDSSAIEIAINYTSYICDSHCSDIIFDQLSNSSMKSTLPQFRILVRICGFIGQMCLLMYFRDVQTVLSNVLDQRHCTNSDFSIQIQGIPIGSSNNSQKLKNILSRCLNKDTTDRSLIRNINGDLVVDQHIKQLLLIQNLDQYFKHETELQSIIDMRLKSLKTLKHIQGSQNMIFIEQQHGVETKIQHLVREMAIQQMKYFCGHAIVAFNTQDDRDFIIDYFKGKNQQRDEIIKQYYQNYDSSVQNIKITRAYEPNQIIWENCHFSYKERLISIGLGWLFTIILLSVVTVAVFFLIKTKANLVQQHTQHDNNIVLAYSIGIGIAVFINIVNKFALAPLLHKITEKYQRHQQFSSLQYSFAMKYLVSMFFTTALMVLIVEGTIFHNYSGIMGLTSQETFMFAFNAYFSPIVLLINPDYISYCIKKRLHYGEKNMTQEEANNLMQYPVYTLGKRYAEIIKTVWFTFMYAQLIPLGTVFSCTGLFLYYLIDKFVLLRRSSVTGNISSSIAKDMLPILQFALILKPFGEFLFEIQIRKIVSVQSIVMMAFGLIYLIIPKNILISFCCVDRYFKQSKTYQQAKNDFKFTYSTLYPINKYQNQQRFYQSKPQFPFLLQQKMQPLSITLIPEHKNSTNQQQIQLQNITNKENNPTNQSQQVLQQV